MGGSSSKSQPPPPARPPPPASPALAPAQEAILKLKTARLKAEKREKSIRHELGQLGAKISAARERGDQDAFRVYLGVYRVIQERRARCFAVINDFERQLDLLVGALDLRAMKDIVTQTNLVVSEVLLEVNVDEIEKLMDEGRSLQEKLDEVNRVMAANVNAGSPTADELQREWESFGVADATAPATAAAAPILVGTAAVSVGAGAMPQRAHAEEFEESREAVPA